MSTHARQLLEAILADPTSDRNADDANDLLQEFHRGYPILQLRVLLHSSNDAVVECGVWIASEMGIAAKPLLQDIASLLSHASARVRGYAIDCMLCCTSGKETDVLANVAIRLEDGALPVRAGAMNFLARASGEQLEGVRRGIERVLPLSDHSCGCELLSGVAEMPDDRLEAQLRSPSALDRRYAVIAAARRADSLLVDWILEAALKVDDEDVKRFAQGVLYIIANRPTYSGHRWR